MRKPKFNVGEIVQHKGFDGIGSGGRLLVIELLEYKHDWRLRESMLLNDNQHYKLQYLHTYNVPWDSTNWNTNADVGQCVEVWEDKLEYEPAYLRDKKLNQLGIGT